MDLQALKLAIFICSSQNVLEIACRPRDVTISCILMSLRERPFSQASLHGVDEGFYNFSKVCLQFFSFLNVVFFRLFYDNITFQHLFIIIKCPAELNFDCKILIRSMPSTFVTELLLRGYVFLTFPKPTPSCMCSETNNNALSNLSYNGY